MKTILFALLLGSTLIAKAQIIAIPDQIEIIEQKMTLNTFERNGFKTVVDGEDKIIMKELIKFAEQTYAWKLKVKNEMLSGQDLFTPTFSDKHFTIQAYIAKTDAGKELRFFGSFGTDIYINTIEYAAEASKVKDFMKNFIKKYYSDYINTEVLSKNKELAIANKSINTIAQKISTNEKQINKASIKIKKIDKKKAKAEEKIRKTQESISTLENETSGIKKNIETFNKSKEKLQETEILEKEKTKLVSADLEVLKTKLTKLNSH